MGEAVSREIEKFLTAAPYRIVLTSPAKGQEFTRINLSAGDKGYFAEKLTKTQAFHEHIKAEELEAYLLGFLGSAFSQLHAWCGDGIEYALRITKSGKVLTNRQKGRQKGEAVAIPSRRHNREKNYLIPEGADIPILKDIGVFTSTGTIAAHMYDKFRQINRFLEFINDVYKEDTPNPIQVVDFGCGKSYLTFLIYHYFTVIRKTNARIIGLDLKAEVIEECRRLAEQYDYSGLDFRQGDIAEYKDFKADMLIALHACDTATDSALYNAVSNNTRVILAAPCCQHELNGQIKSNSLNLLTRYGVVKERTAALLTDSIRANLLTWKGYKTQLLEFVDFAHTPKNLLIRAVKANIPQEKREKAYGEVMAIVEEFNIDPMLLRLFGKD